MNRVHEYNIDAINDLTGELAAALSKRGLTVAALYDLAAAREKLERIINALEGIAAAVIDYNDLREVDDEGVAVMDIDISNYDVYNGGYSSFPTIEYNAIVDVLKTAGGEEYRGGYEISLSDNVVINIRVIERDIDEM